jgi:hydrogenase-4 component B
VSDPILPLLLMIVAALLALGAAARGLPGVRHQVVGLAGAGLAGLGFMLTALAQIIGQDPGTVTLPLGPPGFSLGVAFDPLAAFFLLAAFLPATASIAVATEAAGPAAKPNLSTLLIGLAGIVLALLAADAITLAFALALLAAALWTGAEATHAALLAIPASAALLLLGATAPTGFVFAGLRDGPAQPTLLYVLTLAAAAALAGIAPLHRWRAAAHAVVPRPGGTLLTGSLQPLAAYLLLRLLLDAGGSAARAWWAGPLLVLGAATALIGSWRAAREAEVGLCLNGLTERQGGLTVVAIGLAVVGLTTDLPSLTSTALAAALLLAFAHSLNGTLAQVAADAVADLAGSRRLVLLGGALHTMPVVAAGMAAALASLAAIPAGAGYAALWMLFQALLAAPRALWVAVLVIAIALSAALADAAAVRLFGVAFLGRPRGPRAAAATDIASPARPGLWTLTGLVAVVSVFPGLVLTLADPAIRQLRAAGLGDGFGWLGIRGAPVLPLIVAGLILTGGILWLLTRWRGVPAREGPAWNDGFAPPPPWLPFGDPVTESTGEGFLPPLPPIPPLPRLSWRWRPRRVAALPCLLVGLVLALIALMWIATA